MTDFRALCAGYEPGDGSMDGAMLVDGEWWHPIFGCDSLQMVVDCARIARACREAARPTDEELRQLRRNHEWPVVDSLLFAIARAVLARWGNPTPQLPASVVGNPTDEELLTLLPQSVESGFWLPRGLPSDWVDGDFIAPPEAIVAFARDVLELWGCPAPASNPWKDTLLDALVCNFLLNAENEDDPRKALSDLIAWEKQLATDPLINPAPQPLAEGEVAELVAKLRKLCSDLDYGEWGEEAGYCYRAAYLLQRQYPQPVPVSERLPGPEDCVPHPRTKLGNWCWGFEQREVSLARPARWRLMHMETVEMEASHWLPAHALPLPDTND